MSDSEEFLTFQEFSNKNQALELANLLDENQINYKLVNNASSLNESLGGGTSIPEYAIMLRKEDFAQANHLQIEASVNDIDTIDADYYLLSFSDDELRDVIVKSDEWNKFDFLLAQKLLKDRGFEIGEKELATLQEKRFSELAKPARRQIEGIIAGYILVLLGGFLGIIIGLVLSTQKKTLPNGVRVYTYQESDRIQGRIIFILGILMLVAYVCCFVILKNARLY